MACPLTLPVLRHHVIHECKLQTRYTSIRVRVQFFSLFERNFIENVSAATATSDQNEEDTRITAAMMMNRESADNGNLGVQFQAAPSARYVDAAATNCTRQTLL